MNLLEYLLNKTPHFDAPPKPFGAFHIFSVAIILLLAAFMVIFRRYLPKGEQAIRIGLLIFGLSLFFLEIGKQITYSYTPDVGWEYNWGRFPFQFCSTPIYAALVAIPLRDCKMRRAIIAFLATYSPVAGCAVMFYPSPSVFHKIVFINVHTMIWHGAMLLFGLYLWLIRAVKPSFKAAFGAVSVYLPTTLVALMFNEIESLTGFAGKYSFNMFYISRYGRCGIPLLSWVQNNLPYPVFFLSYTILLGVSGMLVMTSMYFLQKATKRVKISR